jgi:hypothetical protein
MPSLREQQRRFADALLGSAEAAAQLALAHGADAQERLAIYRHNVLANYRNALGASYPVVCRLVGAAFFDTAVDAFVQAWPSTSGDLNEYGAEFGDFLARYPYARTLPYLPDVGRLEWAIDEARRAPDCTSSPQQVLDALAATAPELLSEIGIALARSCDLVASWFPILRIWRVNQPGFEGDDRVDLDAGADRLLVRRDADGVAIVSLDLATFRFLHRLASGSTLGDALAAAQAADAAFDLGAALSTHIAAGTLACVEARPVR